MIGVPVLLSIISFYLKSKYPIDEKKMSALTKTIVFQNLKIKEIKDNVNGENVKLVLCHFPILMWKDQHYGAILLYGHVHNSIEEYYFKKCLREMNNEDFFGRRAGNKILRAYNVGCMMPYMNYEPQTLKEIIDNAGGFSSKIGSEVHRLI